MLALAVAESTVRTLTVFNLPVGQLGSQFQRSAILSGCGGTNGSEAGEDIRLDPAELTEENSFPIRIVNASGRSVGTIEFSWYGDAGECYLDLLGSGETLEKDEVLDTRIQPTDGSYFVQTCAADEEAKQISYLVLYGPDVEQGSVLVLLPDDEQDVKILFDAGTDAREAEKKALADYQAASEGKPLPSEEETGVTAKYTTRLQ